MSWETLQAAFLRHREGQGLAEGTLWLQRRCLADFRAFCQAEEIERPEELTPEQVRAYHRNLLWRPGRRGRLLAPNSLDHCLRGVRTFLSWAHREGS
jgi:site-specific recombinase XerD